MNLFFDFCVNFSIYAILAMSLNLVVGYCGMLTLAHAGFFALGAYCYGILATYYGLGIFQIFFCAFCLGGMVSFLISLPAWRLKNEFFVLISIAVQSLIYNTINNWYTPSQPIGTLRNLTNGPLGLPGVIRSDIFGIQLDTIGSYALFSTGICCIIILICFLLIHSPWSRTLIAMRDDELAARGIGKSVRLFKVQAFFISCGLAAVSGCLYASYAMYIDPSMASLDQSILMLSMVIVGGVGNFRGPLVGVLILSGIPILLRFINLPPSIDLGALKIVLDAAQIRMLAYGLLIVFMMHKRPQGLAGNYRLK